MDQSEKIDLHAEPAPRPRMIASRWLLALIGGVPALATLLAFGGRWAWQLDLLSHFRVQYAIVLMMMVVVTLFMRQRKLALVLALPLVINLGLILPLYFHPRWLVPRPELAGLAPAVDPGPTLKLLLYSLGGELITDEGTLSMIRDSGADLIVLSGVTPAMLERLEYAIAPFRVYQTHTRRDGSGVAVLVRISIRPPVVIRDSKLVPLTDSPDGIMPQAIQTNILWQGRPLVLLALNATNGLSARGAALQATEFAHVAQWVHRQTRPIIVAGDLNTTPWSWTFHELLEQSGLHNTQHGFGVQGTWPATGGSLGQIPLDHCLTDLSLTTIARKIGPSLASSHHSLLVSLQWTGGASDLQPKLVGEDDQDDQASEFDSRIDHRLRDTDQASESQKQKRAQKRLAKTAAAKSPATAPVSQTGPAPTAQPVSP